MTHETNGIVTVKFYYIQSVNSGLYLAPDTNESGGRLYQFELSPTQEADNQMWALIEYDPGSGIYRIFNAYNGLSIDVKDGEAKDGAAIQQYEWRPGQLNQLWAYNSQNKWLQTQISSSSVMVLDVKGDSKEPRAPVQLYKAGNQQANQQWNLIPATISV
jgi:hypothetical protein